MLAQQIERNVVGAGDVQRLEFPGRADIEYARRSTRNPSVSAGLRNRWSWRESVAFI